MPQITVSDEVLTRAIAFKPVVEEVLEVSLENDAYIDLLLRLAPDYLMVEFFGGADSKAFLVLLQRIGQGHPEFYAALADVLHHQEVQAIESQRKAEMKSSLGFPEPRPQ